MPLRTLLLITIALQCTSCSRREETGTDLVTFPLRGEIVALDTMRLSITVAHEAIPNYMNAMTMPFKVKDRLLLRPLSVGDSILATLAVSRTESWLEGISVIGKGEASRTLTANDILTAKIFKTGERFPEETLLDQDGKRISTGDFRGRVLALTFIYTRCPLPDYCIRMSNHFARLQKMLTAEKSLAGKWHLLSVSFDPQFDRPAVLKRYALSYGAAFSTWSFATDPDTAGGALRHLADGLGLSYADDGGLIAHNLRTVLIDQDGVLIRVIHGNEWTVDELLGEIRRLAQK